MVIPFEKMHGLGNDFVVVRREALAGRAVAELVPAWCDRRRGVGGDGVIVLSEESDAGFVMRVHNRDGSVPEICGNGIRCAVLSWAARRGLSEGGVVVSTGAGPKPCRFAAGSVTVDMGPARLDAAHLPPRSAQPGPTPVPVSVGGLPFIGLAVSMGNPHLVLFADEWPPLTPELASPLEHHAGFAQRTNVSFATEPRDGQTRVVVWERGVGFTQACGSAACAVAVAAAATGRLGAAPHALSVALPGGLLAIEVSADLAHVAMTGPAVRSYVGRIELA